MGYLFFFWKLQRSFVLVFWSSKVFNFLLVILGVFKFFWVKFHKWGNGVCAFFSCELWRFFVFIFWNSRIFNFLLVILGVFNFFVWSFTRGEMGYFLFFLWTLKVFCFDILKFQNLQFSSCHFGVFNFLCEVSQARKWSMCLSSYELWRFLFWYFEIPKSSICFLSFWKFHMGGNNVGGIFLIWGFSNCFDGVQGSSTLLSRILGFFQTN